MKIIDNRDNTAHIRLGDVCNGQSIRFPNAFSANCKTGDIFIVNSISGGYMPNDRHQRGKYDNKMGVTNLRSGALCYVDKDRSVEVIDANIIIGDCCHV